MLVPSEVGIDKRLRVCLQSSSRMVAAGEGRDSFLMGTLGSQGFI